MNQFGLTDFSSVFGLGQQGPGLCVVQGCGHRHFKNGYCRRHYGMAQKGKDPSVLSRKRKQQGNP